MKKLFIFVFSIFCIQNTFASEIKQGILVSDLTTTQLKAHIQNLEAEKKELKENQAKLSAEYGELSSFLDTSGLTNNQKQAIKDKLTEFIIQRNEIQKKLNTSLSQNKNIENLKKDLIQIRVDIYRYLAQYVDRNKQEDFLSHIKFHIQSEKESKDLIGEIKKSQNILEQKIEHFKEQIIDHKNTLQEKIDDSITLKIKQRIDEIDTHPKYTSLSQKVKNTLYSDFIKTLEEKKQEINSSNLTLNSKDIKENIIDKMIFEIRLKIK